jgi:hypothetical protein
MDRQHGQIEEVGGDDNSGPVGTALASRRMTA